MTPAERKGGGGSLLARLWALLTSPVLPRRTAGTPRKPDGRSEQARLAALEAELRRLEQNPPPDLIDYLREQAHTYPEGSLCRNRLEETIRSLDAGT